MNRFRTLRDRLSIAAIITITIVGIVLVVLGLNMLIYPTIFSKEANTLIKSQSKEINKQIIFNYQRYINDVIETSNYLQQVSSSYDTETDYSIISQAYSLNSDMKEDVVGITLFDLSGNRVVGRELGTSYSEAIQQQEWFYQSIYRENIFYFSAPHAQSMYQTHTEEVISVSKVISYKKRGFTRQGVLLIELNFEVLTRLAELTNLGFNGHLLIINEEDALIYNSAPELPISQEVVYPFAVSKFFGSHPISVEGVAMMVNINTLDNTRWRIVTVNNVNSIPMAIATIWRLILIIGLISLVATVGISVGVSSRITRPLKELRKSMAKIEQGHFKTKLHISGQKELMVVAHAFNTMAEEIQLLMSRVVEEQREKRKTELRILQNQINPHFLYNTLDSIVWLAEHSRTEDVITMVTALARFFRISISRGKSIISVEHEVAHITSYLVIQKIRYDQRFNYTIDISPEIYPYSTMKLLLQPLVENAIEHGVHGETEHITVKGYRNEENLIFEVTNTGYGLTDEQIQRIDKNMRDSENLEGVGMKNVYKRIKLYYGEGADVHIMSEPDSHTTVSLIIPAIPFTLEKSIDTPFESTKESTL